MSKSSGEKARAAIQKKRRTAQRAKDRTRHAELKSQAREAAAQETAKKA